MCGAPVVVIPVRTVSIFEILSSSADLERGGPSEFHGPPPRDRHSDERQPRTQDGPDVPRRRRYHSRIALVESADMPVAVDDDLRLPYAAHLDTLSQRLEQALAAAGLDALCVFAGTERFPPRDDVPYPFRIEPYFKAFVPLTDAAAAALTPVPGRRPRPSPLPHQDFLHAPPPDPEGFWTGFVDDRTPRDATAVARLLRDMPPRTGAIGDPGAAADRFASVDDPALLRVLDFHRAYKTTYEIACLERASAIAVRGHRAAADAFAADTSEFDLHQRYCDATGQRESELPYNAIVAVDRHAAVLHYQRLD